MATCIIGPQAMVQLPYLDKDLCDFLLSLPATPDFARGFHDAAIERAFPEYADIPYEDSTPEYRVSRGVLARRSVSVLRLMSNTSKPSPCSVPYVLSRTAKTLMTADARLIDPWINPVILLVQAIQELQLE